MPKNKQTIFASLIIFLLSMFIFSSCDENGNYSGYTGVRMIDNSFSPPVVRIHEGGKVRFYNSGNNSHNVVAIDESWGSYNEIEKNSFINVTYANEGLYKYLCSFHASPEGDWGMVGSVVVGDIDYQDYTNFKEHYSNILATLCWYFFFPA